MTEKETPDAVSPENAANLLKLEEELKRSRDHWGVTYKILKRIREGELWRNGGFQNYTLWLAEAAKKSGMHASELWKRFGAGRHYEEYLKREAQVGRSHPSIETVEASPNTIALAYRLAGDGNWVFADSLMTDILDGKIRRADLNDAWKAVKEAKSEAVREKKRPEEKKKGIPPAFYRKNSFKLEAVLTLSADSGGFLVGASHPKRSRFRVISSTEPVSTETAGSVDCVIIENRSTKTGALRLHGISVEPKRPDGLYLAKEPEKATPYDYRWLAVPTGFEDAYRDFVRDSLPGWGLLVIKSSTHSVRNALQASEQTPDSELRLSELENLIIETLEPAP